MVFINEINTTVLPVMNTCLVLYAYAVFENWKGTKCYDYYLCSNKESHEVPQNQA